MTNISESFVEPRDTYSAQNVIEDFYRQLPSDKRFKGQEIQTFQPNAALPASLTEQKHLTFTIPANTSGGCYQIQTLRAEVKLKLCQPNGTVIGPMKNVSVTNNVLNSLFDAVEIKINGQPINSSSEGHAFKSYLGRYISFSEPVKDANLDAEGFDMDVVNAFDNMSIGGQNGAFSTRADYFKVKNAPGQTPLKIFTNDEITFIGVIDHDMASLHTGLPPGTSIEFLFKQTPHRFRVLTDEPSGNFVLSLRSMELQIPVKYLQDHLYSDLKLKMTKTNVNLHFKGVSVRTETINQSTKTFHLTNIFSGVSIPVRIVIGFVSEEAALGKYDLNPFNFRRVVSMDQASDSLETENNDGSSDSSEEEEEDEYEESFINDGDQSELESVSESESISVISDRELSEVKRINRIAGKKSGKSSVANRRSSRHSNLSTATAATSSCVHAPPTPTSDTPAVSATPSTSNVKGKKTAKLPSKSSVPERSPPGEEEEVQDTVTITKNEHKLFEFMKRQALHEQSRSIPRRDTYLLNKILKMEKKIKKLQKLVKINHCTGRIGNDTGMVPLKGSEAKANWIKSVVLQRSNVTIDPQIKEATYTDDKAAFVHTLYNLGYTRSQQTCSMKLQDFYGGSYIRCWDLSTSGDSNLPSVAATVLSGTYSVKVEFKKPLVDAVQMIMMTERPASLTLDKNGSTSVSYFG